jgi:hypothetical protein
MGFDQKGKSVFCVVQGESGKWHVSEEGFEKPIASFESRNDAEKYANDLAATKEGSTVKMPEQMGQQASRMQGQGAGNRS